MSSMTTTSKAIRENIARSKVCFRRHESIQGLRIMASTMEQFLAAKLTGPPRYEIEVGLTETMVECNRDPDIQIILTPPGEDKPVPLKYVRGKEPAIISLLGALIAKLEARQAEQAQAVEQQSMARRDDLIARCTDLLREGDLPRAKAFIRKLLDEFGETQPNLYAEMSTAMAAAGMALDAAEFLEKAIERFPRETSLYTALIGVYAGARQYDLVDGVYRQIYKQFGLHPRTMINQAKACYTWGRRQKAVDVLLHAVEEFPDSSEARNLLEQINKLP
jgi:tetratricopeptide (TPR) repeat protein